MEAKRAALEAISSKPSSDAVNDAIKVIDPAPHPTETERAQKWAQSTSDEQNLEPEVIDSIGSPSLTLLELFYGKRVQSWS